MSSSKCAVSSSIKTSKAYKVYKWLSSIDFSEENSTTTSRKHNSFLGSSIPSWRDSPGSTNMLREMTKRCFFFMKRILQYFLRPGLVRTPFKPHFCSLHELHMLCISREKPTTKLTHIEHRHRELNPGSIGERQGLSPLRHLFSAIRYAASVLASVPTQ